MARARRHDGRTCARGSAPVRWRQRCTQVRVGGERTSLRRMSSSLSRPGRSAAGQEGLPRRARAPRRAGCRRPAPRTRGSSGCRAAPGYTGGAARVHRQMPAENARHVGVRHPAVVARAMGFERLPCRVRIAHAVDVERNPRIAGRAQQVGVQLLAALLVAPVANPDEAAPRTSAPSSAGGEAIGRPPPRGRRRRGFPSTAAVDLGEGAPKASTPS